MREFDTGATRDTDAGKVDYEGHLSPTVWKAFGEYMHRCRHLPDGSLRASDNWQLGMSRDVYMKSMFRHFMEVWDLHRNPDTSVPEQYVVDELCALMFNVQGYLHEFLKGK